MIFFVLTFSEFLGIPVTKFIVRQTVCNTLSTEIQPAAANEDYSNATVS